MKWHILADEKPADGEKVAVVVTGKNGEVLPRDEWYEVLCVYCDGMFYELDFDRYLGVLRKVPVHGDILEWTNDVWPDWH